MANAASSDHGGVGAGGLELRDRLEHEVAEARSSSPAYSANTAPITATATAIFAPLQRGRAARPALDVAERLPARGVERAQQLELVGVDAPSASSVVTTTGKKQTSAMIASFGTIPKPNQTTSSGAMITIGTACDATSSG